MGWGSAGYLSVPHVVDLFMFASPSFYTLVSVHLDGLVSRGKLAFLEYIALYLA